MDSEIENRLARSLAVEPGEHVQLMLSDVVTQAEREAGKGVVARFGRRGAAAVVLIVALCGGATAAAVAAPDLLAMLFPPAVSNTFTFESGIACTVDTKIVPDFATSTEPEVAVQAAQEFLARLDVSTLPVEAKYREIVAQKVSPEAAAEAAQAQDSATIPLPQPAPKYAAESQAVQATVAAAIFADLDREGLEGGVAIESAVVTCN